MILTMILLFSTLRPQLPSIKLFLHNKLWTKQYLRYLSQWRWILFLIERLWKDEVRWEKENLSEMFLVFKQLLRGGGRGQACWKLLGRAPSFIQPPITPHFLLKSEKMISLSKKSLKLEMEWDRRYFDLFLDLFHFRWLHAHSV